MSSPPVGPKLVQVPRRLVQGPSYPIDRLLPLVLDAIEGCAVPNPSEQAIQFAGQIRAQCLHRGMPLGYWTYLARQGTAWLRFLLEDVPSSSRWNAMASVLLGIRRAGYPAPPSAELLRYWSSITEADYGGRTWPAYLRDSIPEAAYWTLFRTAGSLSSEADVERFLAALPLIQQWLLTERPSIDRNRQRAGWPWLVSRSRRWLETRRRSLIAEGICGRILTGPVFQGGYTAVPVATGVELLELGLALHNCLPSYLNYYLGPTKLMYRVEDAKGNAVAAVALDFDGTRWQRERVAGMANQVAPHEIRWLGMQLAVCAQQAMNDSVPVGRQSRPPSDPCGQDGNAHPSKTELEDPDGGASDLDGEDSDNARGCPYCDSEGGCDHLLLRVDTTFREPLSGPLYEWLRTSWRETFRANEAGTLFDEGVAFDELLGRVEAGADSAIEHDFNGAVGQSSVHRVFYCSSPQRTVTAAVAVRRTGSEVDKISAAAGGCNNRHPLTTSERLFEPALVGVPTLRKPHFWRIRAEGYRELLITKKWGLRGGWGEKSIRGSRVIQTIEMRTDTHYLCKLRRQNDVEAAALTKQNANFGNLDPQP